VSRVDIEVEVRPPCSVHIGADVLGEVSAQLAAHSSAVLIGDAYAMQLHASKLVGCERLARLELPRGEAAKDLATLERALDFFATSGLDRGSLAISFGGGAACDLAGFAASIYMRGIDVVHCPTTLLAQVDASVGGKTAVNLRAGKNLAGTFHQPRAVFADVSVLATLDDAEMRSGLGEVVKSALIAPPGLLERVESAAGAIGAREAGVLADIVASCVRLKARIVVEDEREFATRRVLNLGHTFAHAIEHVAGYGRVPHGVAVAVGITLALDTSRALGMLNDLALPERVSRLLGRLGLATSLAHLRRGTALALGPNDLLAAMRLDKKSRNAEPALVLPRAVGALEIDVRVDPRTLLAVLG
jgi:3-dehydroquinate synthase